MEGEASSVLEFCNVNIPGLLQSEGYMRRLFSTGQVLPNAAGAHAGMDGAFIVLASPEDEDQPVLYVEYVTGSLQVEKPEEVAEARLVFDRLRSVALSPSDSVTF